MRAAVAMAMSAYPPTGLIRLRSRLGAGRGGVAGDWAQALPQVIPATSAAKGATDRADG